MYINEVKRDKETLKKISEFQSSIENLWSYGFYLIHLQGKQGFQFFCKTEEMKRKWMEQFEMAMSGLLIDSGKGQVRPKMVAVQNYHGNPAPPGKPVLTFQIGDVIELLRGDPDSPWWEGRLLQTKKSGYFPSSSVKPCPVDARPPNSRPPSREIDYTAYPCPQGLNFSSQSSSSPFWSVFTPRVIGTAVARYNFAARDMRELSLREGDVVKIYSRIGGDQGWWKGETNGRVSASR
ncbi:hypothetical protein llap_19359 [Limosa lapponica baueri]|uniref:Uncharacterized protein n=1 Tax=Limosa lapponica baueri TaxID=1758121 RepID=A0A2I0T966_LIMLA|nr:hypothetical protein llap_19359 [Limosa lapponica baueri]